MRLRSSLTRNTTSRNLTKLSCKDKQRITKAKKKKQGGIVAKKLKDAEDNCLSSSQHVAEDEDGVHEERGLDKVKTDVECEPGFTPDTPESANHADEDLAQQKRGSFTETKDTEVFTRHGIVASTPLLPREHISEFQTGSCFWSDDSQISDVSVLDLCEQETSVRVSSECKSQPADKVRCKEETNSLEDTDPKGAGETTTATCPGATPFDRINCHTKKTYRSRRKSLPSKDYRRGSLLRNYLSSAFNFTLLTKEESSNKTAKQPELMTQASEWGAETKPNKTTAPKPSSSARGRHAEKENLKALSKTLSSLQQKIAVRDIEQLMKERQANISVLSSVQLYSLNAREISLMKNRRKKLYTQCSKEKFSVSPVIDEEDAKEVLVSAAAADTVSTQDCSSQPSSLSEDLKDVVEGSVEGIGERFSSVMVDDEISVCVKTGSCNTGTPGRGKSTNEEVWEPGQAEESYVIHSRDKSKLSINCINEELYGSYMVPSIRKIDQQCAEDDIPLSDLIQNTCRDDKASSCEVLKPTWDAVGMSSAGNKENEGILKKTENEDAVVLPGQGNEENKGILKKAGSTGVKKKKRLLQRTGPTVFDLEACGDGEGSYSFPENLTCNQTIMSSVFSFNQ